MVSKHQVSRKMIDTNRQHHRIADSLLNQTGVHHSQHHTLLYLSKHPDSSQTEIAKALNITPAATAVTLKKLESGGYVTRKPEGKDNRCNLVNLTPQGANVISQGQITLDLLEERIFSGFSQEELEQFYAMLTRMEENLKNIPKKGE